MYKGDFENGQFHGVGRLKFANKGEYEGEWRNGRRQGANDGSIAGRVQLFGD